MAIESPANNPNRGTRTNPLSAPREYVLSVVVPCYNEEECINETYQRLVSALEPLNTSFEIVFVNDGSRDQTLALLDAIATADSRARVISFSRNFGHQTAVSAGIDHASGDAVVLIDADLQDPPEVIGEMLAKWREGYQVVYGQRRTRPGETEFKRQTARAFYRFLNRLSEVPLPLDAGDFRLMDRRVVTVLQSMPERARYIRGMVSWVGFKQIPLLYDRHERFAGESKYPLRKMITFAMDGVISFSTKPLKLATAVGFWTSALAAVGIVYAVALRVFTTHWVSGWTLLMVAVLFLAGVQLVCIGIIGEYVGRLYTEAKGRPLYVVAYDSVVDARPVASEPAVEAVSR